MESDALNTWPFGRPKWDLFECLRLEFGGLVWQEPCASGASQHAAVHGEFLPEVSARAPNGILRRWCCVVWGIECPYYSRVERNGSEAEEPKPSHSRNLGRPNCCAKGGIKAGNCKLLAYQGQDKRPRSWPPGLEENGAGERPEGPMKMALRP